MTILGLTGRARCGKDTVYSLLSKLLWDKHVEKAAFADALKADVCKMVGCTREFMDASKENFRLVMQGYGTDVRRTLYGENYWIKRLDTTLVKLLKEQSVPDLVVITDVRFPNEAQYIKECGGKIWRINRGSISNDTHPSETELEKIAVDDVINNGSSMAELQIEVERTWLRMTVKPAAN